MSIIETALPPAVAASSLSPLDKNVLPEPIFDREPGLIELYWEAWARAWDQVTYQEGMPQSPYMDEAHAWQHVNWIWDTCFMVHFCKYAPNLFPGIESLNNFYSVMYGGNDASIKIWHADNPPLFAWTELEHFKITNDKKHILTLLDNQYLQKHFRFFESPPTGNTPPFSGREVYLGKHSIGYSWNGDACGMDNTPRGGGKSCDEFLWIDALAQHGLAALSLARLMEATDNKAEAEKYYKKYESIKSLVNDHYWDKEEGFYFDRNLGAEASLNKVWTPASYWPMLAEMCSADQAESLRRYAESEMFFGGEHPWPSVARNDSYFIPEGRYWRGGIWLPLAYMATKALDKYKYYETSDDLALNLLKKMEKTFKVFAPSSIWESYSPTEYKPSTYKTQEDGAQAYKGKDNKYVIPNFCGWSALGPIALLIENVLGFHVIDASTKCIEWRKHQEGRHGIKRLRFGDIMTDIIALSDDDVYVKSTGAYTLFINDKAFEIGEGEQRLAI